MTWKTYKCEECGQEVKINLPAKDLICKCKHGDKMIEVKKWKVIEVKKWKGK